MKDISNWLIGGLAVLLLAACGGGSDIGSDSVSGVVADGYLVGAKVFCDLDGDLTWDAGEPAGTTGAGGRYVLTGEGLDQCTVVAEIIAGETVDEDNPGRPVEKGYFLTAPVGRPEFLSPLTTMIQQRMAQGEGLSAAETALRETLGAPWSEDLLADYIAARNDRLHAMAQAMAEAMGEIGQSLASEPDRTFVTNAERMEAVAGRMQELMGMSPGSGMTAKLVRGRLAADIAPEEVDSVTLDGSAVELPVLAGGNFWLTGVSDGDHSLSVRLTDGTILEMPFRMMGGGGVDLGTVSSRFGHTDPTGFDGRFGRVDENNDGINDRFVDEDGDGIEDITGMPGGGIPGGMPGFGMR